VNYGFSLSADQSGNISHKNKNKVVNGWEGWIMEWSLPYLATFFLMRYQDKGKFKLAISKDGKLQTTQNKVKG